ncbi:Uncharacterised protein [Escherichia coli]|nr:Uncharacterised protein [Escherichia coli]
MNEKQLQALANKQPKNVSVNRPPYVAIRQEFELTQQ